MNEEVEWNPNDDGVKTFNPAIKDLPYFEDNNDVNFYRSSALSWSRLKRFVDDPVYYMENPDPTFTSDGTELGSYLHCALLEPEKCSELYKPFDAPINPRTRAPYKSGMAYESALADFRETGFLPLTEEMTSVGKQIFSQMEKYGLINWFQGGVSEVPLLASFPDDGFELKGKIDYYREDVGLIDFKTTQRKLRNFGRDTFRFTATEMGYVYELAYFAHIIEIKTGYVPKCQIIAAQTTPPFQVGVYTINPKHIEIAWDRILNEYIPMWIMMHEDPSSIKEYNNSIMFELYA